MFRGFGCKVSNVSKSPSQAKRALHFMVSSPRPPVHLKHKIPKQLSFSFKVLLPPLIVLSHNVSHPGNAGSPLDMIPAFKSILTSSPIYGLNPGTSPPQPNCAILSIAPRSYWKSTRKSPSERAITIDYLHVLHHALDRFPHSKIVVFGYSLGAAAAICLLSQLYTSPSPSPPASRKTWFRFPTTSELTHDPKFNRIQGLILENPFTSIPDMVQAFYPEKWLPHHYLGPLVADKWDCVAALRRARNNDKKARSVLAKLAPDALILQSEYDETVPRHMGVTIHSLMQAVGDGEERLGKLFVVRFAHHNNGYMKDTWAEEIKRYLRPLSSRGCRNLNVSRPERVTCCRWFLGIFKRKTQSDSYCRKKDFVCV